LMAFHFLWNRFRMSTILPSRPPNHNNNVAVWADPAARQLESVMANGTKT
jgi:hypothetical protein